MKAHQMNADSRPINVSGPATRPALSVLACVVSICSTCVPPVASGQQERLEATSTASGERATVVAHGSQSLRQLNTSLVGLTNRVSPSVVQIVVDGYGPSYEERIRNNVSGVVHQRTIGSGVIVDAEGYILTNAHVVESAQRIRVAFPQSPGASPLEMPALGKRRILDAALIGTHKESDLALLKVEAHDLPALEIAATRAVYPGELVLAIGSPEGLQGSVSMGIVSSVWRQPNPDMPLVFIQTDVAINSGNSGGPLIDVDGHVIGLNTFILSRSGGSEGLGFAIPARVVRFVYDSLRKYGFVQRAEIGAGAQEITPPLAAGLGLSRDWGVLISDVAPAGPAAAAGLKSQDIIDAVDGRQVFGLPGFNAALYLHPADEDLKMDVLRGAGKISVTVPALQHRDKRDDLADLFDPRNVIDGLGVCVVDLNNRIRPLLSRPRYSSGVVVTARSPGPNIYSSELIPGDIIYGMNQRPIESVQQLRSTLQALKPGEAVVLQIERATQIQYIAFEWGY
jgi:serine protease Do